MPTRIEINNDLRPAYYDDFRCSRYPEAEGILALGKVWHTAGRASGPFSTCRSHRQSDYLSLKRQEGSEEFNARMDHGLRRIRKGPLTDIHFGEFDMDSGVCPLR